MTQSRHLRKFLGGFLILCMALSTMCLSAFAVTTDSTQAVTTGEVSGSTSEQKTSNCDVFVNKGATFSVRIPTSVTMDVNGSTGSATYNVAAKGDIEDGSSISIAPSSNSITFAKTTDANQKNTNGTITQATTSVAATNVSSSEYAAEAILSGTTSVTGLTAGTWKSQITFNVSYTAPAA